MPALEDLRPAFLGHAADRLNSLICEQTEQILADEEIETPVRSVSVVLCLEQLGPSTIAELARIDGQSHQTVSARMFPLLNKGLVEKRPDRDDGRKVRVFLTKRGKADAIKLKRVCADLSVAMTALVGGEGRQLFAAMCRAEAELRHQTLLHRIASQTETA